MAQHISDPIPALITQPGFTGVLRQQLLADILGTHLVTLLRQQTQLCNAAQLARMPKTLNSEIVAALEDCSADHELQQLQQEVLEAHVAVLRLRRIVPDELRQNVIKLLKEERPSALQTLSSVAGLSSVEEKADLPLDDLLALETRLDAAIKTAPSIKAALADALDKLYRNVTAAESTTAMASQDTGHGMQRLDPSPPDISPGIGLAVKSGAIATRRRAAKQLCGASNTPKRVLIYATDL